MLTVNISTQCTPEVRQEKDMKDLQIRQEEINLSL